MLYKIRTTQDKTKAIEYIQRLPGRELGWKLNILPITKSRSGCQNSYMWYVFELISKETGQSKDDIHDFYCQKFLSHNKELFGETILKSGTSELDTRQFEEFMTNVRQHAQEFLNIFVPLPNEVIYDD